MNNLYKILSYARSSYKIRFKNNLNLVLNMIERKLKKTRLLSYPVTLDIVPTKLCNLNCIFCIQYSSADTKQLTLDSFKIIAKKLFPYVSRVNFCSGGEPFLNKDFMEFLSICRESRVMVNITSNGTLLSEAICKKLIENDSIMSFNFSFDGAKKGTVESIRRGIDYQKVVDNMRTMAILKHSCKRKIPLLNIRYTVMRRNIEELPDLVLLARKWGIDTVIVNYLNVANGIDIKESLLYHPELTRRIFKKVSEISKIEKIRVNLPRPIGEQQKIKSCEYPWKFMRIDPDGSVRFCYKAWVNPIGNIFTDNNLCNLWNNMRFQLLRKTLNTDTPYFKYCSVCSVRRGMEDVISHVQSQRKDLYKFNEGLNKLCAG